LVENVRYPRGLHTADKINEEIYLIGGDFEEFEDTDDLIDVHCYNIKN